VNRPRVRRSPHRTKAPAGTIWLVRYAAVF